MPNSRRIKVLHAVESYAAGTKTVVDSLTTNLDEVAEHFILYGEREYRGTSPGGSDRYQPWTSVGREFHARRDLVAARQLAALVRDLQPDIIHLHSTKAGAVGRIVARALGKARQVVYTPHGAALLRQDVGPVKRHAFGLAEAILSMLGGSVVACSESERRALARYGVRAHVIENGVPVEAQSAGSRKRGVTTVATVGRMSPQKDPAMFNRIATECRLDPELQFVWVGDGPLRSEINAPNVRVTGWLDSAALREELRRADIYLSTSLWEGMSLAPLEAMAAGAVLLLRECTGNVDIMERDATGELFTTELQAIRSLKTMKSNISEVDRERNRRLVSSHYNSDRMASDYLELYLRLTGR